MSEPQTAAGMLHQCPGCWGWSSHPADRTWECECGERLSRIDLRNPEPSPFPEAEAVAAPTCPRCGFSGEHTATLSGPSMTTETHAWPAASPGQGAARSGARSPRTPAPAFDPLTLATCPDCGHQAKNVAGLAIHRGRAHGKKALVTEGDPTEPNGHDFKAEPGKVGIEWFLCPHCTSKYAAKAHLDDHVTRRHPPTPGLKPVGSRPSNQTFTGGIGAEKIA